MIFTRNVLGGDTWGREEKRAEGAEEAFKPNAGLMTASAEPRRCPGPRVAFQNYQSWEEMARRLCSSADFSLVVGAPGRTSAVEQSLKGSTVQGCLLAACQQLVVKVLHRRGI